MTEKKIVIDDPLEKRVEMINGQFDLPGDSVEGMKEIRIAVSLCARTIHESFKKRKVDIGRAIAAMDSLQQAKNIACDALILPHATK